MGTMARERWKFGRLGMNLQLPICLFVDHKLYLLNIIQGTVEVIHY